MTSTKPLLNISTQPVCIQGLHLPLNGLWGTDHIGLWACVRFTPMYKGNKATLKRFNPVNSEWREAEECSATTAFIMDYVRRMGIRPERHAQALKDMGIWGAPASFRCEKRKPRATWQPRREHIALDPCEEIFKLGKEAKYFPCESYNYAGYTAGLRHDPHKVDSVQLLDESGRVLTSCLYGKNGKSVSVRVNVDAYDTAKYLKVVYSHSPEQYFEHTNRVYHEHEYLYGAV